jgi:hypothetical protein
MGIPLGNLGVVVEPDGKMTVLEDEVGTAEAARILRCAQRTVQSMCDEGRFEEGSDWRKLPGRALGGKIYRIKRTAVIRIHEKAHAATGRTGRIGRKRD